MVDCYGLTNQDKDLLRKIRQNSNAPQHNNTLGLDEDELNVAKQKGFIKPLDSLYAHENTPTTYIYNSTWDECFD